jgi:hypothetical protein
MFNRFERDLLEGIAREKNFRIELAAGPEKIIAVCGPVARARTIGRGMREIEWGTVLKSTLPNW